MEHTSHPAGTADPLLRTVRALVQRGFVHRLWLLLLDGDGGPLPPLHQIDGIPVSPDAHAVLGLRGLLGRLAEPDASVAAVLERPGGARPTPDDWAWHDAIRRAAHGQAVPVRAVLLAHSTDVDRLEPDPPPRIVAA